MPQNMTTKILEAHLVKVRRTTLCRCNKVLPLRSNIRRLVQNGAQEITVLVDGKEILTMLDVFPSSSVWNYWRAEHSTMSNSMV